MPDMPVSSQFEVTSVRQSTTLTNLYGGLLVAQEAIQNPKKNKTATVQPRDGGKAFTFKYADLAAVLDAVRPALNAGAS
jgi:hypothetical protein